LSREATTRVWRLRIDAAADGPANMAADEAMLSRYRDVDRDAPPTLRLYGWHPPALSLGRGQPAAGAHDPAWLRSNAVQLVRRPTGGRAVLHELERTYAVVGSTAREPFSGGVVETYRRIAVALVHALRSLGADAESVSPDEAAPGARPDAGPAACFAIPTVHEIRARGGKLVGSAQLRSGGAFLQHGSIPLAASTARLEAALGQPARGGTDLRRATGRAIDPDEVDRALIDAFASAFDVDFRPFVPDAAEVLLATRLRAWKYDSWAWTIEGRAGPRERRWGPPLVD
jgi:lipoate-protein ligase A